MNTKSVFREIDALTGENVPIGDGFDALKRIIDPVGDLQFQIWE